MAVTRLSDDEVALVRRLQARHGVERPRLEQLDAYYDGEQRLQHLGIALPPDLRSMETVVNVPRMAVDEPTRRQRLIAFQRSGSAEADPALREAWEANNLASASMLLHKETRLGGWSYVTVGANPDDPEHPRIAVEDAHQFTSTVDARTGRISSAMRLYRDDVTRTKLFTLYLPDSTIWLSQDSGGMVVEDREDHRLGRVAAVKFLNRPRARRYDGTTEMQDVLGLTDAIARMVTNMQVAGETHAVPVRHVAGMSKGDFVDKNGKPLPVWESYFTAIMATEKPDARFGQFQASDLRNFHETVDRMLAWCASQLGLPVRYMGNTTIQPPTEGSVRADEGRLIANVEAMNLVDGDAWCWVMDLYERFRTGDWLAANAIRAIWQNPATPTLAQATDSAVKLHAEGIISREGVWDEMGWDEARKDRERAYFAAEAEDPLITSLVREVRSSADSGVDAGAVPAGAADRSSGVAGGAESARVAP